MKLTKEILSDFEKIKKTLEDFAKDAQESILMLARSTDLYKDRGLSSSLQDNSLMIAEYEKYQKCIRIFNNAIEEQDISDSDVEALSNTRIPKLVQIANDLRKIKP